MRKQSNELPGYCGRRGVLETWTAGDGGTHDQAGRAYVGQRFVALAAAQRIITHRNEQTGAYGQARLVLVHGLFADGTRLWLHGWDVRLLDDSERGVA